jgi:defect-in-organelle-trafficking protein DotB
MKVDDLPSIFESIPLRDVQAFDHRLDMRQDLDDTFINNAVEFCKDRQLSGLAIYQARPVLALHGDNIVSISDREVYDFEFDDLIHKGLDAKQREVFLSEGYFETSELCVTEENVEIPFKKIFLNKPPRTRAFFLKIDGVEVIAENFSEKKITENPFAGFHDGTFFDYDNYMDDRTFDHMLRWATEKKASDITVQPGIPVKARIGSEILPITRIPVNTDEIERIIRHISSPSAPAEIQGGAALDPAHEVFIKGIGRIRFRVNITGGRIAGGSSAQISLRTLPTIPVHIRFLELEPELIKASTSSKDGLVLFCGPTGSGKSTTMSSLVRFAIEKPDANLKVIEFSQPIEYIYDGIDMYSSIVWQTTVGKELRDPEGKSHFAYAVANAMRRNPDWIIIGEARDTDTMQNVLAASQSGHMVMSTMHTTSVANTIRRAVNMFPEGVRQQMAIDIMEQLRVICIQRLIPKIGGGRVAVREFMVFGETIREAFLREKVERWPLLVRRMFAEKRAIGQSMQEAALRLLIAGKITEEVYEQTAAAGIGI